MRPNVRLPDFMIIGAMRCGSTTLWKLLKQHPAVFFPETKELHYFDDRRDAYKKGINWYGSFFSDAKPDEVAGEATPNYLYLDEAREKILREVYNARIIVILRDPVERAWSHYWFRVRQGLDTLSFRKAIEIEDVRIAAVDDWSRFRFAYRALGHYATFLRPWVDAVGLAAIQVVFLEDLVRDPGRVMRGVLAHIGLSIEDVGGEIVLPHMNRGLYARSIWLQQFARAWVDFKPGQMGIVERAVRRLGRKLSRLNMSTQEKVMPESVRQELIEYYEDSDIALEEMLSRTVPWRTA